MIQTFKKNLNIKMLNSRNKIFSHFKLGKMCEGNICAFIFNGIRYKFEENLRILFYSLIRKIKY